MFRMRADSPPPLDPGRPRSRSSRMDRIPAMLRAACSAESTGRSVDLPAGSPTKPVAPPSSATDLWPHLRP